MENQKVKKVFRSRISVLLLGSILAVFIPCTIPIVKHMIIPDLWIMGGTFIQSTFIACCLTKEIAHWSRWKSEISVHVDFACKGTGIY
ncbi:MAG: hypothetical protein LBH92_06930 [Bacteroidales bacterium]|nr:hypothetical protein [Bacteroidales bacterium]